MIKIWFKLTLTGIALAVLANYACADQRYYVWTYQYQTLERGTAELESYTTFSSLDLGDKDQNTSTELQYELEVGMTDRFDFSVYQVFVNEPGQDLRYKGFKLRSRYRFGETGSYFMDPLVYLEYKGEPELTDHTFELKLILARDWDRVNLALNPILEIEKEGGEWEFEPEYALGASYEVSSILRLGLELKGGEEAQYLGPVLAHGYGNLWMAFGSGFRLTESETGQPDYMLRLILGVGVGN